MTHGPLSRLHDDVVIWQIVKGNRVASKFPASKTAPAIIFELSFFFFFEQS